MTNPTPTVCAVLGHPHSRDMSLFELDESLCLLMDSATEAAAENNGEIPEELRQAMVDYCEAFGQKVDNIAHYVRSQEFAAANASEEIDRLTARKAAAKNRVTRIKGVLTYFMQTRDLRCLKGRLNTISLRKNSQDSLVLADNANIPTEYTRVSVALSARDWEELLSYLPSGHGLWMQLESGNGIKRETDEASLRAALVSGAVVEGAEMRRGHHIRLT